MSLNESGSLHAAEDWGIVLQSVPSKHKREVVKQIEKIFELDKADAEQILSNVPLVLMDNLSFWLAVRIKKFFQSLGAIVETTNHDVIKKNCLEVLWPKKPDLSFFMKSETGLADAPVQERKNTAPPMEMPKIREAPRLMNPAQDPPVIVQPHPVSEEKPAGIPSLGVDSNSEGRVEGWEKKTSQAQHSEATEKAKKELQQELEAEKKKSREIAKAYEDLQMETRKHEALTREGEAWCAKAKDLEEKVRELETHLTRKTAALDHLMREKEALTWQAEKAAELTSRVADLEKNIAARDEEKAASQGHVSAAQQELENYRSREEAFSKKIEALERNIQEMTESLRFRDGVLAQFEKQISELVGMTSPKKEEPTAS
jgi:hypothetical protein